MTRERELTAVVIDDQPEVQAVLEQLLGAAGFRVLVAGGGEAGVDLVAEHGADVVLLDLLLPGIDGFETCRRLREVSDAYVIMLTSKRSEVDRIAGLTIGADDYVTKPFSGRELLARVRAMLRRPRAEGTGQGSLRRHGELQLDLGSREVRVREERVELTRIEFAMLELLTRQPSQVRSRAELLERIWGPEWVGEDHLVDVHMSRLRRKLGDDARVPRYVVTVRGVGYRMGEARVPAPS
jgi:DNA-binding response OmpR family regulator